MLQTLARNGKVSGQHSHSDHIRPRRIALIGNPNSGKTTVFNGLTGLHQKVANYPGVTVEKKEGRIRFDNGEEALALDLPGTYSLTASSPDEKIATDVLLGTAPCTEPPGAVVCVVDAGNLDRNLYLVSQILDCGLPLIIALNMLDTARAQGIVVRAGVLERVLGVPVIPMVASKGKGFTELKQAIAAAPRPRHGERLWQLPGPVLKECEELKGKLRVGRDIPERVAFLEALELLTSPASFLERNDRYPQELIEQVKKDHRKLEFLGFDRGSVAVQARYTWIRSVCEQVVERTFHPGTTTSDRIDRVLTHRVWGFVIFLGLMALMFQMIFAWASIPTEWIGLGFDWIGRQVSNVIPPGDLHDLIKNGALGGVSAVVSFLPQILLLFFFLGLLEDTGYMARAAFIMDRLMSKVGLHGKSFIPLLSSFACAIPGIMATRTIENPRDRTATMLVAPLMSCSARLPVYALMIAAFIPNAKIFGVVSLPAVTLLSMYLLGLVTAVAVAWLLKKTLSRGTPPAFMMELPPYRFPSVTSLLLRMWERSTLFLRKAGTIILGVSVVLWFLASYPRLVDGTPSDQLQHSIAGRAGKLIEPVIKPLGFNWKIGIGLITSLMQREVFVSTMGTIYNVQHAAEHGMTSSLREQMRQDIEPSTGKHTFTSLTALCVMVYYVLSMQCLSTVVVLRRETNGWKWPLVQIGYMTALAYSVTFAAFTLGTILGIGG